VQYIPIWEYIKQKITKNWNFSIIKRKKGKTGQEMERK